MALLSLLFIWILSFTECSPLVIPWGASVINERELGVNSQGGSCSSQFQNCVKTYFGLFDNFQRNYTNGLAIIVDKDSVDMLCSQSPTFQECLASLRNVCRNNIYWGSQRVHYYISLVTYVCSQEGMAAMLKTAGSQCDRSVNYDRMRSKCEIETQRTYQLEKEITDRNKQKLHCSFIKQYRQCSVGAITKACGAAVADFLEAIDQQGNAERYDMRGNYINVESWLQASDKIGNISPQHGRDLFS